MSKMPATITLSILIIINVLVCTLDVFYYENGLMDNLLFFIPLALLLTCLNYFLCNKTVHLIIIQSITVISCFICSTISVNLYSKYISNDTEGYIVSILFLVGQIVLLSFLSSLVIFIKKFRVKKI